MVALSPLWIAFALAAAVCGGGGGGTRGGDDEEEEEKQLLSDIKVCGDEDCSMWLYKVEAVRDYDAPDCHFVSFRTGDVLYVYHMLAGRRDDLWAGSAGLQFGYFPKDAVKVIFKEPSAKDIKKPTKFTDFMCLPSSHQNAKTSDDESHGNDDLHMGDVEPTLPQVKASGSENQMPRVPNEEENISKQHQVNGDTRTEKDSDMKSPEGDARVVTPQGQPSHVHGDGKPLPVLASHPKASEDKSRNDSEIASDPEVDAALFPAEHSEIGQGTLNVESPREASSVSNAYAIKKDVNALALKENNLFSIESNEDEIITPEDNASSDLPELQILLTEQVSEVRFVEQLPTELVKHDKRVTNEREVTEQVTHALKEGEEYKDLATSDGHILTGEVKRSRAKLKDSPAVSDLTMTHGHDTFSQEDIFLAKFNIANAEEQTLKTDPVTEEIKERKDENVDSPNIIVGTAVTEGQDSGGNDRDQVSTEASSDAGDIEGNDLRRPKPARNDEAAEMFTKTQGDGIAREDNKRPLQNEIPLPLPSTDIGKVTLESEEDDLVHMETFEDENTFVENAENDLPEVQIRLTEQISEAKPSKLLDTELMDIVEDQLGSVNVTAQVTDLLADGENYVKPVKWDKHIFGSDVQQKVSKFKSSPDDSEDSDAEAKSHLVVAGKDDATSSEAAYLVKFTISGNVLNPDLTKDVDSVNRNSDGDEDILKFPLKEMPGDRHRKSSDSNWEKDIGDNEFAVEVHDVPALLNISPELETNVVAEASSINTQHFDVEKATQLKDSGSEINDKPPAGVKYEPVNDKSEVILENKDVAEKVMNKDRMKDGTLEFDSNVETKKALGKRSVEPADEELTVLTASSNSAKDKEGGSQVTSQVERTEPQLQASSQDVEKVNLNVDVNLEHLVEYPVTNISEAAIEETGKLPEMQEKLMQPKELVRDVAAEGEQEDRVGDSKAGNASLPMEAKAPSQRKDGDLKLEGEASDANKLSIETPMPRESGTKEIVDRHDEQGTDLHAGVKSDEDASDRKVDAMVVDDKKAVGIPTTLDLNRIDATSEKMKQNTTLENNLEMDKNIGNATLNADKGLGVGDKKDKESLVPIDVNKLDATSEKVAQRTTLENNLEVDENIGNITLNVNKSLAGDVRDVVGDTFEENKIGDDVHLEKLNKGEVDSLVEATIGNGKEMGSFKEINPLFKESSDDVKPLAEDEPLQGSMRETTETFTPLNRQHAKAESKLAEGNKVPTGDLTTKEDMNKKEMTEQVNEKLRAERLAIEDAVTSVNFEISKALADSNVQLKTTLDKKYMELKESRAAMDSKMKSPNEELTESKGEMEKRDDLRGVSMERSLKVEKKYYSNLVKVNSIEEKLNMMDAESKTPAGSLEPVKETVDTNGTQEENNGKKGQAFNEAEIMSTKQAKIVDKEVSNDDAYQSLIHTDPLHKELREKVSEVSKEPVKEDVDPKGIVAKRNEAANEQHFDVKDMDRAGAGLIYSQDEEQLLMKETKSQQIFELKKALTEENKGLAKVLGKEDSEIIDTDPKINLEFKKGLVGNNGAIAEASHGHHTLMNPEVKIVEDVKLNEDLKEAALGSEELLKINETAHLLKDVSKNDDLGKDNIGKSNASLTEEDAKAVVDTEKEGPKESGMLEREKQNKYVEGENEISEAEGKLILAMNKGIAGEDEKLNEALNSEYLEIRDAKAEVDVNVNKKRLELDEREGKDANLEPEKNENSYVAKPTAADEKNGMLEREKLSNYAEGENEISEAKEKLIVAINKGIAGEDERLHDALNSEYLEMRDTKAEMDLNVNKKRLELDDLEGKDANVEPEKEENSDVAKPTATEEQSGMLERLKLNNFAEGENEISEAKGKLILAINKGIASEDERLHIALNSEYLEMRDAKAEMDSNVNKKRWVLGEQEEKDVNMEPAEEENLGMAKPTAADEQSGMLEREKLSNYAEGENEISEAKEKLILAINKGIAGEDERLHDALNSEYLEMRGTKAEMDLNVNKKRLELNDREGKDVNVEPEEEENSDAAKLTATEEQSGMLELQKVKNFAEGENEISEAKGKLILAINKGIAGEDERLHIALNSEYLEMRDAKAEMDLNVNKKRWVLDEQGEKYVNMEPEEEENLGMAKPTATDEQSGMLEREKRSNYAEGENEIGEAKDKLILEMNKGISGEDEMLHDALNSEYLEKRDPKAEMDLNVNKKRLELDIQEEKDANMEPEENENSYVAKSTAADEKNGMLEREKLSNYAEGENEISEAKEKLIVAINKGIAGEDERLHDALNSEYLEMRDTKAEMDLNVNKKRLELDDLEGKDANVEPEKEENSDVAKPTATEEQSGMLERLKLNNFAEGENEISEAKGKLILAINKGIAGEDERLHIALNSEYLEMRDAKAEMDSNVNKKRWVLGEQEEKDVNMEPAEEENLGMAKPTAADEQSGMLEREKLSNYAEGENEISEAKEKLILAINKGIAGEDDSLHDALNSEYLEMRDTKAEMDLNVNKKRLELNDREGKDVNVEPEKEANSDAAKLPATEEQSGMLVLQKVKNFAEGENEISEAKGKLILAINKGIAGEDERLHIALNSEYLEMRDAKAEMDLNVNKKHFELNDQGEKDVNMEPEEEENSDAAKLTATEEQSGMLELQKLNNFAEGENEISEAKDKLIFAINEAIAGEDERLHNALNSEYLEMRDAKAEMDLNVNMKRLELNDQEEKDLNEELEKEENSDVTKPTATEDQSGMLERQKVNKYAEGENEISEAKWKLILAINKGIAGEDEKLHDALDSEYIGIREAKVQMDLNVIKKPLELNDHGEKDVALELEEILDRTKPSATEKVTEGNYSHKYDVAGTLQKKDVAQDIEIREAAARVRLTMKRALAVDGEVSPADFKGDVATQKETSQLESELKNAWYQVDDDLKDEEDFDDGDANDEAEQTVVTKERIKVRLSQSKHGAGIKETQLEKNANHEEDLSGKEGMSEKDVPTKQSTLDVKIREDLKIEQFANKADLEMLAEQGNENVVKSDDLARDEEANEEPQEEQVDKEEVDKLEEKDLKGRVELNDDEDVEDNLELEEEEMDPEPADEELYYLDDEEQEDQKPVEEEEDEDKLEAPEDEEVEADVSSSVNVAEDHKQIANASNDDGDVESDDPLNDFDEELDDDDDESDGHRVDDNMTNEMDDLSETELLEDENALASEVGDEIYLETDQSRSDQNISQITTAEDEVYPDVLEQMDLGNEQNLSAEDNIMKEEIETLLDVDDAHADEKRRVPTGNSDSENDGSESPSRKPDDGPPEFEQTVVEDYLSEERQSRLRRILTETKLSLLEDRLRAFERELADSKIRAEGTMEDVEKSLDSVMDRHEGRVLQWLQEVLEDVGKQHEEAEEGQDLEEEEEEAYEERVEVFNDVQDVVFAMRKRFSMSMESVPIAPGAKVKVKVVQDKFSWLPSDKNGTLPDLILRMDSAFLYVRACVLPSLGSLLGMVASQLPAEWRPGPSYHGVPWDVVATGLCLGIAFSLAFLWRLICVFQNRRYLRREARHIQTVKKVLEEKHELAEQLANARKEIHGKASSLQGMLEGSKSSKQAIAKLQTEHRELQESICERRSEMEAIRHSLQSMQQQWEQQNSLKLRLQRSTEGVEQTLGSLKADLEAVLSRVGTANSNNDKMEAKLVKMEKENEQLQRSNRRLEEEVELCDTSVGELTETLRAERQTQKSLEEAVAFKQNEVEAMTACLNQLKDLGVDSESLDESEKRKQKQKLQELMDVSKVNVMLRVVEEEIEEYGSLLRDEVAATHKLEGTLEAYENKNASLAAEKGNLCEELARCKQKLNMVKQMYEEKEVKLQRKLTLEETHREQNKGKLSAVDERVLKAIEDASIHRRKVEDLREELNKTEKNYKDQISTNEKKVHENWLKARTAEREMVASKKEVATLKERMSDIELKLALLHRPPTYQMDFQRGLPLQPLVVPTHRGASLRDGSSFTSSPVSGPPSPPMLTDEPRRGPTRAPGQPRRTPRAADNGPSSPLDSTDGLHNPIPAGRPPELRAPHGHAAPPPGPHEPAYPRHSPPRGQHIPPAQAGPRGGPQTSPLSAQGTPPPSTRAAYGFPQQQRPAGPTAAASASQNGALRGPPGPGLPPPAAPYGPPLSPAPSGGPPPMQRQFYPPPPQGAPGAPAQGQLAPPEPLVPYDSQPSQGRRNPPPPWQGAPGQHPPQGSAGQRPPPQGPPGQPPMLGPPGQHPSQGHPGHPPPQGARGQPPSQGHPGHRPPQGPPGQPPHLYAESQLQHSQAPQSPPLSQAPRMPPPSQGPFAPPPWQGIRGPHPPPSAQGFHGRPSLQELRPQHRLPPPPASSGGQCMVRSSAPNSRDK
uniref:Uncharacterized protein LOC116947878 n=1 Tax=Petromyzon marinus TaxID=7757 RepID=A0AAJ7X3C6_PETMA|nr:uncharacterized protein LOC116947878 [Petromyzon marinus]